MNVLTETLLRITSTTYIFDRVFIIELSLEH